MYTKRKISKYKDSVAFYFDLGYSDIDMWSLTIVDAYRTPTAQIVTKEYLDNFLKSW